MPWTHCGRALRDDQRCPCGINKLSWTVISTETRRLVVGKKGKLEFTLLDPAGKPVAGEPYVVVPVGQSGSIPGTLDADGSAKLTVAPGEYVVRFPDRERPELEEGVLEVTLLDDAGKPLGGEPYEVVLPGGDVRAGTTTPGGRILELGLPPGRCAVRLPARDIRAQYVAPGSGGRSPGALL